MKVVLGGSIPPMTSQAASRRGPQSTRHQVEGQERELRYRILASESSQPAGEIKGESWLWGKQGGCL